MHRPGIITGFMIRVAPRATRFAHAISQASMSLVQMRLPGAGH